MNASALEVFLAQLYTDDALRAAFVEAPERVARAAGLDGATLESVLRIDRDGLLMAAHSYACKRAAHGARRVRPGLRARLRDWLAR